LKQAISTGNAELIRLMWQRVPEGDRLHRADLLQVAADFHREAALGWLFRDAAVLEREILGEFVLDQKLSDGLLVAVRNGLRLWSSRTRDLASRWPAAREVAFVDPPNGLSIDCGWSVALSGEARVVPPCDGKWFLPDDVPHVRLAQVTLPRGVTRLGHDCFNTCRSMTRVWLPEGLKRIGKAAFYMCGWLTKVVIPPSVSRIGGSAFSDCDSLKAMMMPRLVTVIEASTFKQCCSLLWMTIPHSVTSIGDEAFRFCSKLATVVIPPSVRSIGALAFGGCQSLTTVTIPPLVTSIGWGAFISCRALASVAIPSSMRSIQGWAFLGCESLTEVTIPSSCRVAHDAFEDCPALIVRV
jgi:hypothetical protein